MTPPERLVSLVPSLTETVATFGVADRLVGVTRYCVTGAPPGAARIGGTKNPDLDAIAGLAPDLVLANAEENRSEDIDVLRSRGLDVLVTFPRSIEDVATTARTVGAAVGTRGAGDALASAIEQALIAARAARPPRPVRVVTLIWRRPWMAVGHGTYVDALLTECGFANVLPPGGDRYPRVDAAVVAAARPDVVLLPSEPYPFSAEDVPAVQELCDDPCYAELVDGALLTWHGPRTPAALARFGAMARSLAA